MVSIVEVTTKAQLRKFVDYPNRLYEGVPKQNIIHLSSSSWLCLALYVYFISCNLVPIYGFFS